MQDVIHSRLPTARVAKCISAAALVAAFICAAPGAYAQAAPAKALATAPVTSNATANNIYGFKALDINGKEVDFAQFKDRVLLIVNTASQCGFTPQLTGLEQLHKKYQAQGLVVIGFPCNQFLQQDPKSNAEIDEFAQPKLAQEDRHPREQDAEGRHAALEDYLGRCVRGVMGLSDVLATRYFTHSIDALRHSVGA